MLSFTQYFVHIGGYVNQVLIFSLLSTEFSSMVFEILFHHKLEYFYWHSLIELRIVPVFLYSVYIVKCFERFSKLEIFDFSLKLIDPREVPQEFYWLLTNFLLLEINSILKLDE